MDLQERARRALPPEPIVFTIDEHRQHHFAQDMLPFRTAIDPKCLPYLPWITLDEAAGIVTLALDGRTAIYRRAGVTLHGEWVCDLDHQ